MDVVSSFWSGASRYGSDLDLESMARAVGGFETLEAGGVALLKSLDVPPLLAESWLKTEPIQTLGVGVTLADERYPAQLRDLVDAPPVLFIEGEIGVLSHPCVAIVGTRKCTSYGASVARHLGYALASRGITVVSGLARGVDGHAHRAAMQVGATVAVLGHGLGHTAPQSHRRLRMQLLERGGAIVSSWPDDRSPRPFLFPRRNRWISGLCTTVVVVEAAKRSGARITAEQALSMNRSLFVVPGLLGAPMSRGCLELVAEGAELICDVEEFVASLTNGRVDNRDWKSLLFTGRSVTEVAKLTGRSCAELFADLALAEVRGEVVRMPGERYAPSGKVG